jgi:hypothetical protein
LKRLGASRLSFSGPNTFVRAFKPPGNRHQRASLVKQDAKIRDAHGGKSVGLVLAPHSNRQEILLMTKTTKALLAGAALAGLFAGTGAAIKASTLFPSLKTSFSAQDQDQGQDKKRRQEGQGKARL